MLVEPAHARGIAGRLVGAVLAALTVPTAVLASSSAAAPPLVDWTPVAHRVVGVLPLDELTSLSPHVPVRVAGADDVAWLHAELGTATGDPAIDANNGQLLAILDDAYADGLPRGTVLVLGTAWGCDTEPGLVRMGDEVVIVDVSDSDVMCARAVPVVAVIAAAGDDVPTGATDRAELVQFVTGTTVIDADRQGSAAAATLSRPAADTVRRSFLLMGCGADTAEMRVTSRSIDAVLRRGDWPVETTCDAPLGYYVTFDIDRRLVPTGAVASSDPQ